MAEARATIKRAERRPLDVCMFSLCVCYIYVKTISTAMELGGNRSRYAFRDVTNTLHSWALCRTHFLVNEIRDMQLYEETHHRADSAGNKENCYEAYRTMHESVITHWCADCTEVDEYHEIKLSQWGTLNHSRCFSCNCNVTIPYNILAGLTERGQYELAFRYLNARQDLVLTYSNFIEGSRREGRHADVRR